MHARCVGWKLHEQPFPGKGVSGNYRHTAPKVVLCSWDQAYGGTLGRREFLMLRNPYRGSSGIRKGTILGPYCRPVPKVVGES